MLSRSDAAIVAADPAIPDLGTVLDPEAFAAALARACPHAEIVAARPTYVRYKPGTNCLVSYEVDTRSGLVPAYAKAHGQDAAIKLRDAARRSTAPGPLGAGCVVLDNGATAVWVHPNDGKLHRIRSLADDQARQRMFERLFPDDGEIRCATVELLRHNPERRYVARLVTPSGPRAVLKLCTAEAFRSAVRGATAFRSEGPLRVARLLGTSRRRGAVALEWLLGNVLADIARQPAFDAADTVSVGAALATVHAQEPSRRLRVRRARHETLERLAIQLGHLRPDLATHAHELANQLATHLAAAPTRRVPIHGDFYASQVLLHGETVSIIDFDEVARGDPATDVGCFIAHLELDALCGTLHRDAIESMEKALLEGYAEIGEPPTPAARALFTADALFALAPHPFRARDPDWPSHTEAILARCAALLESYTREGRGRQVVRRARRSSTRSSAVSADAAAVDDPAMPFLGEALDPEKARRELAHALGSTLVGVRAARVVRHKVGRRCVIEYVVDRAGPSGHHTSAVLMGKVRARGLDAATFALLQSLWMEGFDAAADDGISIPEPLAVLPAFHMWIAPRVPGVPAAQRLTSPEGGEVARKIAEAAHKIHSTSATTRRRHTMADEMAILQTRLASVASARPEWAGRLERLLTGCAEIARSVPDPSPAVGIHRDFYADQVLVHGARLYVLDFDLFCAGDPALDIGNFVGHMIEQSLRSAGTPSGMDDVAEALATRFYQLAGPEHRTAVDVYAALTLVRHISLSMTFPERRPFTAALLDLCEERVSKLGGSRRSTAGGRPTNVPGLPV